MANTLIAESKLQFYPTSPYETFRMLPFVGYLKMSSYAKMVIEDTATPEERDQIVQQILDRDGSPSGVYYDYFLTHKKYENIKDLFSYEIQGRDIVIADLFAGEGKWLETFKSFIPNGNKDNIVLVANEIEKNRFKAIQNNKYINECYNSAFEDLVLPKKSVSLMLFNPPYGESNGERNARRYLRMILNRELIAPHGVIIAVIREDDVLNCIDLLGQHFWMSALYRVDEEEYKKHKQYVYVGALHNPFDTNTAIGVYDLEKEMDKIQKALTNNMQFDTTFYSYKEYLPSVKWKIAKNSMRIMQNQDRYISKKDEVWKWVKDISELKDLSEEKITLPKPPSTGEIANIISSGMINGELSLSNNKAKHIVVGGVKQLERQESSTTIDKKGEKCIETKTIKYTEPYLNLLINKDGKMQIKELGGSN